MKLFGGEIEEARELALKSIDRNPLHGDWYHGIVGWSQFLAGNYESALESLDRAGELITNYPAHRAACAARLGNLVRARSEYDLFLEEYCQRIAFGREPVPGEALEWAVQVEPFRNLEDSRKLPDALREIGLVEIEVPAALARRERLAVRPAEIAISGGDEFRNDDGIWTIAHEGRGARVVELKGFHDLARLLAQPGEPLHCLELSGTPRTNDSPEDVLDARARQDYRRRIEELQLELDQAEDDNDPARAGISPGRTRCLARRTRPGHGPGRANSKASQSRRACPHRGHLADPQCDQKNLRGPSTIRKAPI